MPTDGPPLPDPKARTLARGECRYRRKVASPKQWQAIIAAKTGPCRGCGSVENGRVESRITFHHVVTRAHGGDDVADNLVPVCVECHGYLHGVGANVVVTMTRLGLLSRLTDVEYAYAIQRGGEGYFERAYGIRYER